MSFSKIACMVTMITLAGSSVTAAGGRGRTTGVVGQDHSNGSKQHIFIVRHPLPIQGAPAPPTAPVGFAVPNSKINSRIDSKIYSKF